ncbi:alpha/beta hydrolase-fold protein [Mucilaginibacter gossypii]|uniref:alpha/beta hydrolase-fold protein n=1 Tax=Mucilaginibacter gossypii TaxID=551996 RepID=UPI000DCF295C|nr:MULTISPECIES: alpha/beta hydrolase-fold protein [Mucilaginibacter]QTE39659.1 alpha/beta hydrolase-fold protein [Mucilaginibacter gossypii]RAV54038.1 alpha/beta hydrolase [Mucilaginibacter rubeus]
MKKIAIICYCLLLSLPSLLFFNPQVAYAQDDPLPARNDTAIHFKSKVMAETRTLWIHVPDDYYTSNNDYPVFYVLDGDSHFNYLARTTDFLSGYDRNRTPKMIVVGVVNIDRGRDFTPVYLKKQDGNRDSSKIMPDTGAGRFLRYLQQEVVPYIDKNYRVQPYRILAAHSLGGLFALYAKETDPLLFPGMILSSPVTTDRLLANLARFLNFNHPYNGKMFVGIGNENTSKVDLLVANLKRQAPVWFNWANQYYPDENHFTAPYKTVFDGLKFIYWDWFIDYYENDNLTMPAIDARFQKLSDEFGYKMTPSEEFLNNCGYYQLRLNHIKNAVSIFSENVKKHPASFNAYDSLGEAYMHLGDKPNAIRYYKKSLELNPQNSNGRQMLEKLEN